MFRVVPGGFIPAQDKQYLIAHRAAAERRIARSDRSRSCGRCRRSRCRRPGVAARDRLSRPVGERLRQHRERGGHVPAAEGFRRAHAARNCRRGRSSARSTAKFASIPDAYVLVVPPPPVQGLGHDRRLQAVRPGSRRRAATTSSRGSSDEVLHAAHAAARAARARDVHDASRTPCRSCTRTSTGQGEAPGHAAVERLRHAADLSRLDLRQRLQSLRPHVPRLRAGRSAASARDPEDVANLKTRNAAGDMVPIGSVATIGFIDRPGSRLALQRLSRGRHQRAGGAGLFLGPGDRCDGARARADTLPNGYGFEWTELAFQQKSRVRHRAARCSRCACCSCS